MTSLAKCFIWAFFLLIFNQALVIMAFKFGLPVKPSYFYCVIASGLLVSGLRIAKSHKLPPMDAAFFLLFLAIVILGAAMYRGENPGPDFGESILHRAHIPSAMSYAVWPALNLLSSAGLYLLVRNDEMRRTIVCAAFGALVLQLLTMEADMWWPAIFGDPNGRAGGLTQNANAAAILVVVLATLTLSTPLAPYAVILALAGTLLSQSRTGAIAALVLSLCFLFMARQSLTRNAVAFAGSIVLALAVTVIYSPVLNPNPEEIAEPATKSIAPSSHAPPVAVLDHPVTLEERIETRTSVDESARHRLAALKFFWSVVEENPAGYGTGFTNKFWIGPHNTFLKLAVDNGIIASILLLALLAVVTLRAFETTSPQLMSLAATAAVAALLFHTLLVDPILLPAISIAFGLSSVSYPKSC